MNQRPALVDLPQFHDVSGNLSFMQVRDHIPFDVDDVRWISGVSNQTHRDDDTARSLEHVIVALAGSFEIRVHQDGDEQVFALDRPYRCLYVPGSHAWTLRTASPDALALVVRSAPPGVSDSGLVTGTAILSQPIEAERSKVDDCAIVELRLDESPSGRETSLHSGPEFGGPIRRVYYLSGIPKGSSRGGHAHRELHQFVVAARGSFDVRIDDGVQQRTITLSRPDRALHLVPGIWRDLNEFTGGSICLVMASSRYDEQDYLTEYDEFRAFKQR